MHVADVLRETSSAGTATTSGPTNKLYATSADTRAISRTTTGQNGQRIRSHRSSLTAARPAFRVTESTSLDEDLRAYRTRCAAWSPSTRRTVEAASSLARSKNMFP